MVEYQREGRRLFGEMEAAAEGRLRALLERLAAAPAAAPADAVVETARAAVAKAAGQDAAAAGDPTAKIGRNDQVTIVRGDERQTLKWKKAEPMLAEGWTLAK